MVRALPFLLALAAVPAAAQTIEIPFEAAQKLPPERKPLPPQDLQPVKVDANQMFKGLKRANVGTSDLQTGSKQKDEAPNLVQSKRTRQRVARQRRAFERARLGLNRAQQARMSAAAGRAAQGITPLKTAFNRFHGRRDFRHRLGQAWPTASPVQRAQLALRR